MNSRSVLRRVFVLFVALLFSGAHPSRADVVEKAEADPILEKTVGWEKSPGFATLYFEPAEGKVYLEVGQLDVDFLYVYFLTTGAGSRPIGYDPGWIPWNQTSTLVRLTRLPKSEAVWLVQPNYGYRGGSVDHDGALAGHRFFSPTLLWSFPVVAESGERLLLDATAFFQRDVLRVAATLKNDDHGEYKLDLSRSAFTHIASEANQGEVEFLQTFVTETAEPDEELASVLPSPEALSLGVRHTMMALPGGDYAPRPFHPACGYFSTDFLDLEAPLGTSMREQVIDRFNPGRAEPIVFYIDSSAPADIQQVMLEGANFWVDAFAAIGRPGGFRAEILPEGVDPMDLRRNVILWVHRKTRGWSYARWIGDPRTGETLAGRIVVDSQRIKHDIKILEGLTDPWTEGADQELPTEIREFVYARLRVLVAHEVGHVLGLRHNFTASVQDHASVMDYVHPEIELNADGTLALGAAFPTKLGAWDIAALRYGYAAAPEGMSEAEFAKSLISEMREKGLMYLSDGDASDVTGAQPQAHRWDQKGEGPARLAKMMTARRAAMARFSEAAIREGAPLPDLEERFAPLYLLHRYEIEATSKSLGGVIYSYSERGDGEAFEIVAADEQRAALHALLEVLRPENLTVPASVLSLLGVRYEGYGRDPWFTFKSRAGQLFDPLAAAEGIADLVVGCALETHRATRLLEQQAARGIDFGLEETLATLVDATWLNRGDDPYEGELQRLAATAVLRRLMQLARDDDAPMGVKVSVDAALRRLRARAELGASDLVRESAWKRFDTYALYLIDRFMEHPEDAAIGEFLAPPVGPPLGAQDDAPCGVCAR